MIPAAESNPKSRPLPAHWLRWTRAGISALGMPVAPLGAFFGHYLAALASDERKQHGLVLILPGIESQSFLNQSVAWGLFDAGVEAAIEIFDWTTSIALGFPYHLRAVERNRRKAALLAERIVAYQAEYPGRPVTLIGHSGGGAVSLFTLEALPPGIRVTRAILLAPAISSGYRLTTALSHTEQGIWNFSSWLDVFFLAAGTCVLGTIDGRHGLCAGMTGFRRPDDLTAEETALYDARLHEQPYRIEMAASGNLAGHVGCTNRLFAAEWLAPIVRGNA